MSRLFRWPGGMDPFSMMRQMQREMDRMVGLAGQVGGGVYPPVNVWTSPDQTLVQCEVAGVKREDIDVSLTGDTLVIKGVKRGRDDSSLRYQRSERGAGEFSRTIVLSDAVEADRIEASLQDGLLEIRLPKAESAKPRQIAIKS